MKNLKAIMMTLMMCLMTILIVSCNQNPTNGKNGIEQKFTRKIDPILDSIFNKQFANYKTNALLREKALKVLNSNVDSLFLLNYASDIPLKVLRIQKNPHGKGAIVQFYADNINRDEKNILSNNLQFEIIGFMSEELASTVNDKEKYFIKGKKFKRLNKTETYIIVNLTYYSPETKIYKKDFYSDIYSYNVGVFFAEVDTISVVKNNYR